MKLRTGFVSNSSTTTFCIYGVSFQEGSDEYSGSANDLKNKARALGLSVYVDPDEYVYLGRDYKSIGDDETGRGFKSETVRRIEALLGKVLEYRVIAEGWYDN